MAFFIVLITTLNSGLFRHSKRVQAFSLCGGVGKYGALVLGHDALNQ
jgi:hypothetical protein